MRAIFITTGNIFDKHGNGGDRASLEHLKMLEQVIGKDNVYKCVFLPRKDYYELAQKSLNNVCLFPKIESKHMLFVAALLGYRINMPWQEKVLLREIDSFSPDFVFLDFSILGRIIRKITKYKTIVFFIILKQIIP